MFLYLTEDVIVEEQAATQFGIEELRLVSDICTELHL